jgi:hypothetical protein
MIPDSRDVLTAESDRSDGCSFHITGNSRIVSGQLGDIMTLADVL